MYIDSGSQSYLQAKNNLLKHHILYYNLQIVFNIHFFLFIKKRYTVVSLIDSKFMFNSV